MYIVLEETLLINATISIEENHRSTRNDTLKIIAMITMLIDHIGVLFFPGITLFRTIGRIAFPIFAYQIALGYTYTHDRYEYGRRLLIFAFISQIPYVFLNPTMTFTPTRLNVVFLFTYSLIVLTSYDYTRNLINLFKRQISFKYFVLVLCSFLGTVCLIALPMVLEISFPAFRFSYSSYGLIMILLFYRYNREFVKLISTYIILSISFAYINGGIYLLRGLDNPIIRLQSFITTLLFKYESIWNNITFWKDGFMRLDGYFFQSRSIVSVLMIPLFERFHFPIRLNKYIGYSFYPLHISLLLVIRLMIKYI